MAGKKKLVIAAAAAGSVGAVACGLSWKIVTRSMGGSRQTYGQALKWQSEHYDTGFFDALEKEEYSVRSTDGYELHALFCRNPRPSTRYMILTHGYSDNRYGSLKYMKLYLDLGYHCIIWDLRGHGANAPAWCTYGIMEGQDLVAMIEDAHARFPDLQELGLHGESLGAATTVSALGAKPQVDFAVADCGFADIGNVLKGVLKSSHLPTKLVDLASLLARWKRGYAFSDMRPVDCLKDNKIPILFFHGTADTFITPDNSRRMYEMTKGKKAIHLFEGAQHAECRLKEPERYAGCVKEWLEEIGKL